jgi:hypothetical protein
MDLLFLYPQCKMWGWSKPPQTVLLPEKLFDTHCTRGWVGPRAAGIRLTDRPVRSELLYRLSYSGSKFEMVPYTNINKTSLNSKNLK